MRRSVHHLGVAIVLGVLAACASPDVGEMPSATNRPDSSMTSGVPSTPAPSVTSRSTPAPSTETPSGETAEPQVRARGLCSIPTTVVLGTVENPALDEASGLVASRRHRDVLWSHDDGGGDLGLFALRLDGSDLGVHPVVLDGALDVEDIALVSGPDGDDVLLADIGDNAANRPSIRVYRFAEPDPAAIEPVTDIQTLEFVYPDRPHNAEVLLVDEAGGSIVIVTKEQAQVNGVPAEFGPTEPSYVFEGPLDGHDGTPVELTPAGMLDAPLLETRTVASDPHPATLLGIGGLPTGGDVSTDGALIALRTYETAWLWPRLPGRSVAESLAADPCQVQTASEFQGEAVALREGSLITLSEGMNPKLFAVRP